jgi:hypothetical protein
MNNHIHELMRNREADALLTKEQREMRQAREVQDVIDEGTIISYSLFPYLEKKALDEMDAEREKYLTHGKYLRDQCVQEEPDGIMPLAEIQEGVDRYTDDLTVYTELMGRQQLNEIWTGSGELYESMRRGIAELGERNVREIGVLREACRSKLGMRVCGLIVIDETLFKIGEALVVHNDKEIAGLNKRLWVEMNAMREKSKKQASITNHHVRELSKVRFLSARCYLILKRNGIVADDKDWTANEEKRRTTSMIEENQQTIALFDRQIREMRITTSCLEEAFESKALRSPEIIRDLR